MAWVVPVGILVASIALGVRRELARRAIRRRVLEALDLDL